MTVAYFPRSVLCAGFPSTTNTYQLIRSRVRPLGVIRPRAPIAWTIGRGAGTAGMWGIKSSAPGSSLSGMSGCIFRASFGGEKIGVLSLRTGKYQRKRANIKISKTCVPGLRNTPHNAKCRCFRNFCKEFVTVLIRLCMCLFFTTASFAEMAPL